MASQSSNKFMVFLLIITLFGIGVGIIYVTIQDLKKSAKSSEWIETNGVIIHSKIEETTIYATHRSRNYAPDIRYRYYIEGKEYIGDRVMFFKTSTPFYSDVEELVKEYYEGKKIKVYYDPQNKLESVLIRDGLDYGSTIPEFILAVVIIVIGGLLSLGFISGRLSVE
jgi:hypothetical protein